MLLGAFHMSLCVCSSPPRKMLDLINPTVSWIFPPACVIPRAKIDSFFRQGERTGNPLFPGGYYFSIIFLYFFVEKNFTLHFEEAEREIIRS